MKQYIKKYNGNLGFNIYHLNIKIINLNYEKKYTINNKRHGLYYSIFSINNVKNSYKGFYNKSIEYSHWKDNNQNFTFRYFL